MDRGQYPSDGWFGKSMVNENKPAASGFWKNNREVGCKGMTQTRQRYTQEFKFQIIVETLRAESSVKEIATTYRLHPNLIRRWKREFLNGGATEFFNDQIKSDLEQAFAKKEAKLCRKIRQMDRQLTWLKRKIEEVISLNDRLLLIERQDCKLSVPMQARLLGIDVTNIRLLKPSRIKDGGYRLLKSTVFKPSSLRG